MMKCAGGRSARDLPSVWTAGLLCSNHFSALVTRHFGLMRFRISFLMTSSLFRIFTMLSCHLSSYVSFPMLL